MSGDVESGPASGASPQAEPLELLAVRDELIGLSAELDELRARFESATLRATTALDTAQRAEQRAAEAADDTRRFGEYLAAITDDQGRQAPHIGEQIRTRAELEERIAELEAVLQRRSVRWPLSLARRLRGS
jgi:chromosome segregation ATPase